MGVDIGLARSEWVARFLNLQDTALLSDFGNVTYDHLRK